MSFDATAMRLRAAFRTGDLRTCLIDRLKELEAESDGISRDIDSGRADIDGHDGVAGQVADGEHGSTDGGQSASSGSGQPEG